MNNFSHYVSPPSEAEEVEWNKTLHMFEEKDKESYETAKSYPVDQWVRFVRGSAFEPIEEKRVIRNFEYIKINLDFQSQTQIKCDDIDTVFNKLPFENAQSFASSFWPLKYIGTTSILPSRDEEKRGVFLFDLESFEASFAKDFVKDKEKSCRYLAAVVEIMHYKLKYVYKLSSRSVILFDISQVSWKHVKALNTFAFVFKVLGQNYPESVHRLIFLNQPFFFRGMLKILSPLLEPDTVKKIETKRNYSKVDQIVKDLEVDLNPPNTFLLNPELLAFLAKDSKKESFEEFKYALEA
eukprot:snap_masked-scaffold_5-processed-gene-6.12-mRNA-1 protein AED:1.00 eAED:1.00 QI:0/-1/0/0/-1/1/1/0/295